jgi:uncharacterized repeat protein (TIGR04138 family)
MSESDPQPAPDPTPEPEPASPPAPRTLEEIAAGTRYPVDAFHFVRRGLDYTVQMMHEDPESVEEAQRHVSGRQLCDGVRQLAVDRYGRLARAMLRRWRINRTADIGRIVFAMVDGGLMQKTEEDSIRDFDDVFDMDRSFEVDIPVDDVPLEDAYTDAASHG